MKNIFNIQRFVFVGVMVIFGFSSDQAFCENPQDHYNALLKQYVSAGRVDYPPLCKDERLDEYLKYFSQTDPDKIADEQEQLAFWINAYNAYNLKVICKSYPFKNLGDLNFGGIILAASLGKTIWDKPIAVVNGQKLALKNIDHEIIRKKFHDPKIQFALACGVRGCPDLRPEVYEGAKLQDQLKDQTKIFFNDPVRNIFNAKTKKAELSPIMNWNQHYFGNSEQDVLKLIADFVPDPVSQSLKSETAQWKVKYRKYDLDLNDKNF